MERETEMLERDLILMAQAIRYPATPDLAAAATRQDSGARVAPRRLLLASAALAALVVLISGVAVVAPARQAVADLFDMINVFEIDDVPPGVGVDIGRREVSPSEAQEALGFEPALPDGQRPSQVLLQEYGEVSVVALFFHPSDSPSYVLFETNGLVGKGIPTGGATAEAVPGLGGEAYWLTGRRLVQYQSLDGYVLYESRRVTDQNTLIWSHNGFVFRVEGALDKVEAIRIALSLQ